MNRYAVLCLFLLVAARTASASITFYINDEPGFNTAVGALNLILFGTEDFEESTLGATGVVGLNDPLAPGVANGAAFPNGLSNTFGLSVQSNTLGASATILSPRGTNGLATAAVNASLTPSDQVGPTLPTDSLDLIFSSLNVEAVGLLPLYVPADTGSGTGTVIVTVYDTSNSLLGTSSISGTNYGSPRFVGIVLTGTDLRIGRINLWDGSTSLSYTGADDISAYGTPEPATFGLTGIGLLGVFWRVRRRRRQHDAVTLRQAVS